MRKKLGVFVSLFSVKSSEAAVNTQSCVKDIVIIIVIIISDMLH